MMRFRSLSNSSFFSDNPIILYFHNPIILNYMNPTKKLMDFLSISGFNVVEVITPKNVNAVGEALEEYWNQSDLIIVGQDNVFTMKQLIEILQCSSPVCAYPCLMYPASTNLDKVYQNMISHGKMHNADDKEIYCTGIMGTGFCRIKKRVQEVIDIKDYEIHWQKLDSGLSKAFHDHGFNLFHLHYPLHEHLKDKMEYAHYG